MLCFFMAIQKVYRILLWPWFGCRLENFWWFYSLAWSHAMEGVKLLCTEAMLPCCGAVRGTGVSLSCCVHFCKIRPHTPIQCLVFCLVYVLLDLARHAAALTTDTCYPAVSSWFGAVAWLHRRSWYPSTLSEWSMIQVRALLFIFPQCAWKICSMSTAAWAFESENPHVLQMKPSFIPKTDFAVSLDK